jgi:dTDP-4-dehydrorhamnose 3,5-epimerase
MPPILPDGVLVQHLKVHEDERGTFTEVFRHAWPTNIAPLQWNCVRSRRGVLRGVHAHVRHADYLYIADGRCLVGLRDLRRESPTQGLSALVEMSGSSALTIPPRVAHGFYFPEPSLHVYAVSEYFDRTDEFGCHWADPALELAWPNVEPVVSLRDAAAPPLAELLRLLEPWQPCATIRAAG